MKGATSPPREGPRRPRTLLDSTGSSLGDEQTPVGAGKKETPAGQLWTTIPVPHPTQLFWPGHSDLSVESEFRTVRCNCTDSVTDIHTNYYYTDESVPFGTKRWRPSPRSPPSRRKGGLVVGRLRLAATGTASVSR